MFVFSVVLERYYFRKLNFEELVETFHARESLEGITVRFAFTRADDDFLCKIQIIKKIKEKTHVHGPDYETQKHSSIYRKRDRSGKSTHLAQKLARLLLSIRYPLLPCLDRAPTPRRPFFCLRRDPPAAVGTGHACEYASRPSTQTARSAPCFVS